MKGTVVVRGPGYWTWFIIAAVYILIFLGLHMIVMHLDGLVGIFNPAGGEAVAWENVIYRGQSLFFTITYIILLGAALYHGFYGFRTMVFELGIRKGTQVSWTVLLWVIGIILFIIGTYAAITIQTVRI